MPPVRSTVDGRRVLGWVLTALSAALVLAALLLPNDVDKLTRETFVQVPVEALIGLLVLLALPGGARKIAALAAGAGLGLLIVVKLLDLGFDEVLFRPFDLVLDWPLLGPAVEYLEVTAGKPAAVIAVVLAGLVVLGLIALCALAVLRLSTVASRRRGIAVRVVAVLVVAGMIGALPLTSRGGTGVVLEHARRVQAGLHDQEAFAAVAGVDRFRNTPPAELLTALRGKDVVLAFVESYGRSAVEHPELGPEIGAVLDEGTRRLAAAGYSARSGFLTSPTAGGGSWLAQATLLSGLWVDNEQRYRTLVASDRLTLNGAFRRTGWRSVGVYPGITRAWPEGNYYGFDRTYAAADLGYHGPRFGYATTPDQFTLASFQRAERAGAHRPVMATIPLVSSHAPWTPTPGLQDWRELGNGSGYTAPVVDEAGRSPAQVRADYRKAIEYSLRSLVSYVETHGGDDLVLVFVGDHQPAPMITGAGAGRDVPITIVAKDPVVRERTSGWGWSEGLKPGAEAAVWPMDQFRDRFLSSFGVEGGPASPGIERASG